MATQSPIPVLISVSVDSATQEVGFSLENPTPNVKITDKRQITFFRDTGVTSVSFNVTLCIVTEGFTFGVPAIQFQGLPIGIMASSDTTVVTLNTNEVPAGQPPQTTAFDLKIQPPGTASPPLVIYDPTIINNPDPPSDGDEGHDGPRGPKGGGSGRAGS